MGGLTRSTFTDLTLNCRMNSRHQGALYARAQVRKRDRLGKLRVEVTPQRRVADSVTPIDEALLQRTVHFREARGSFRECRCLADGAGQRILREVRPNILPDS